MIFREVEDRDLILRARRGDVDAFNMLVSRWEKPIYNYLLRQVRQREDALDLSQETFLKAYRNLGRLQEIDRFPQWLFRIAHNEMVSLYRRKGRLSDEEVPETVDGGAISFAGSSTYPVELSLTVRRALELLTDEQRETVVLKVYQGFKFHEIAEILDCPVSTIKSRLYSAFEVLRGVIAPVAGPTAQNSN